MKKSFFALLCIFCSVSYTFCICPSQAMSLSEEKRILEEEIYTAPHMRVTLYCGAIFDEHGVLTLPQGFTTAKFVNRAYTLEWEHVVPVENFGRTFEEWRQGHPDCVDGEGKPYKGRRCAEKVSREFRRMLSDMHNMYPAIGAVNAARSNYDFTLLPEAETDFGTCPMKIDEGKAEPPPQARGRIARAYLYMERTYPRFNMGAAQRRLMMRWDKEYPMTKMEYIQATRIDHLTRLSHSLCKSPDRMFSTPMRKLTQITGQSRFINTNP